MNQKHPVIREIGNSQGIILPDGLLARMQAGVGSRVEFNRIDSGVLEIHLVTGERQTKGTEVREVMDRVGLDQVELREKEASGCPCRTYPWSGWRQTPGTLT